VRPLKDIDRAGESLPGHEGREDSVAADEPGPAPFRQSPVIDALQISGRLVVGNPESMNQFSIV